ncbi:hypothetical protein BACSP_01804 [Bacillus sp. T2.9-1]|uniref:DUF624 domain-containing protein n=1 Tax=Bacillus sp. T2.9-1 TaxID=3041163 RepID=UPI0024776234|nr:DUF624 domain-containing protein [Bacillus sp. T2.9-1]CAI9386914.1 hypothetical protein BACSP_01804 [Bacillus sp. T2.9-1]
MVWSNKVMIVLDKIISIIYLNVLWIIGTILGLGVAGIFPATYALYYLLQDEELFNDFPSFRKLAQTFFCAYKRKFLVINGIGVIYAVILYMLWIDFQLVKGMPVGTAFFYYPLMFFITYILATILYIFPVTVYTVGTFKQKANAVLLLPLLLPLQTVFSLTFFLVLSMIAYRFSIFLPLFFISTYFVCIDCFIKRELTKKGIIKER